ncbi:hypothetical protein E3J61_03875 [Candidatus Dependentiae bacterium]|nr:MAG: hypothetical protein E3J61_03875 [Candidatus Dependentiae bacterium]
MNITRQVIIVAISFVLGLISYGVYQHFVIGPCYPFPNIANKYKYPALLTPAMTLEHHKAMEKQPLTCTPPKTIILCYDDKFLEGILQKYRTEACGDVHILKDHPSVAIAKFGLFSPTNAMRLERAIAWGVKQIIAIGSSAGLQKDIKPGDILVCEKAMRDEGTSHHYLPCSKYAYPSQSLQKKLLDYLKTTNTPYRLGPSWTTDAIYRTTKFEVERYQKEGVLCVEGEAAALFAVAAYRNIDMIALFTITDSFANLKWEKATDYEEKKLKTLNILFEIALNIANDELSTSVFN